MAALHADTCDLGHPGSPSATEQRRHRNHPDGFWVASTDPDAAQHALTDTIPRGGLQRAAVDSDPEGRRWPRGKRHDDASAASCHLI